MVLIACRRSEQARAVLEGWEAAVAPVSSSAPSAAAPPWQCRPCACGREHRDRHEPGQRRGGAPGPRRRLHGVVSRGARPVERLSARSGQAGSPRRRPRPTPCWTTTMRAAGRPVHRRDQFTDRRRPVSSRAARARAGRRRGPGAAFLAHQCATAGEYGCSGSRPAWAPFTAPVRRATATASSPAAGSARASPRASARRRARGAHVSRESQDPRTGG